MRKKIYKYDLMISLAPRKNLDQQRPRIKKTTDQDDKHTD